jgi:uncharacterized protein YbjT (DUF2867 family)
MTHASSIAVLHPERNGPTLSGVRTILLTGATGYIGGRLLPELLQQGHRVRCLTRRPGALRGRVGPEVEIVEGDCLDAEAVARALRGTDVAYYLVHSMGSGRDFVDLDRRSAEIFGRAAHEAGVRRIIYLGGLGDPGEELSPHLRSRQETGVLLAAGGTPVTEFRSSAVIGSGSLSFEMVRALVERLPVLICPAWVRMPSQPIAVEDVVAYLVAAPGLPEGADRVYEIGGPDVVSYADLIREYARQRGLRRLILPVPLLTPWLSSLWLGLVTPLYARVGRKLIESVRNATQVRSDDALRAFPIRPRGMREAIARAIQLEDAEAARTRWSDALSSSALRARHYGGVRFGSRLVDSRAAGVDASPADAFAPVRRIGGRAGWYAWNMLWRMRARLDLLAGGVGMRRGRPDPETLHEGDALDFWRVEAFVPDRLLRLRAEMRLPGRAWLQFEVEPRPGGGSEIRQTALFDPIGLGGLAYWYALYPVHQFVFAGMLRGIVRRALREAEISRRAAT